MNKKNKVDRFIMGYSVRYVTSCRIKKRQGCVIMGLLGGLLLAGAGAMLLDALSKSSGSKKGKGNRTDGRRTK